MRPREAPGSIERWIRSHDSRSTTGSGSSGWIAHPRTPSTCRWGLDLQAAIVEGIERDDVGALVVWGGPSIFAAGADIKAMAEWGPDEVGPSVEALGAACDLLEAAPKVSIAAVNGYALGGGMELALAADLRLVADDAHMGQPEIRLGVIPGAGGTQRLTRLLGPGRAAELVFTGRQIDAQEAVSWGLAVRSAPADELFATAVEDARAFADGPAAALAAAKAAIAAATTHAGPAGIADERALFLALFGGHDQREGMRAFVEKRPPRFGTSS